MAEVTHAASGRRGQVPSMLGLQGELGAAKQVDEQLTNLAMPTWLTRWASALLDTDADANTRKGITAKRTWLTMRSRWMVALGSAWMEMMSAPACRHQNQSEPVLQGQHAPQQGCSQEGRAGPY